MNKIVIVGGGLSAMMMAKMIISYKNPDAEIIIIEREKKVGGQFGSVFYDEIGYFDYGMHIYYDSCIEEIDDLFISILPPEEWNIMENNLKDVAGIFINGHLQVNTPYIDLRKLSKDKQKEYVFDLLSNITAKKKEIPENAYDVMVNHFGKLITDEVFVPVFEKLYFNHLSNLDEMVLKLTAVNRVALFDEELMLELMKIDQIRNRICYPNQFTLPPYRKNNQRAIYPKKYGFQRVMDKLKTDLESLGVKFELDASISAIKLENNFIKEISYSINNRKATVSDIDIVYWNAGLNSLAATLNIHTTDLKFDYRPPAFYINLVFDKLPQTVKLYYFYCFEKEYRSFRITNYFNYCDSAIETGGYPLCVELWPDASDGTNEEELISIATKELKSFGVIDDSYSILFSKVNKGGGFPLPTLNNIGNIDELRTRIKNKNIENLIVTGVLAEKNQFFIADVLTDSYKKVLKN